MIRRPCQILTVAVLALGLGACEIATFGPGSLTDARSSFELEGQSVELVAKPYRDFMPGDRDTRLIVALKLTAQDPDEARARLVGFGRVWVEHGTTIWSDEVENVPDRIHGKAVLVGRAYHGPRWPVGDEVTVVVEVETLTEGTVRLRAENVEIGRVS